MREYLKIRDDVDLKELEKFGFYSITNFYFKKIYLFGLIDDAEMCITDDYKICVYKKTEQVILKLFDLISAGLVEKVVEDE